MHIESHRDPVRLPHLPALDGLRAFAVVAVILYHGGASFMPGGFLGVELFFVLSGYLITSLLRVESRRPSGVRLVPFWQRRVRRLLPAAYVLIAVTLVYARLFLPSELPSLRQDGAAGFGYVSNWWLILENKSYFEQAGRPSLLQHLWSLAVEAQFYLLFPVLFRLLLARCSARAGTLICMLLAVAGALWMGVRFDPDLDPSPLYYGTDTRISGLLVGAALALALPAQGPVDTAGHRGAWTFLGLMCAAILVAACLEVSEYDESLYRGELLAFSLASAGLIAALLRAPTGGFAQLLSTPLLQAIGRRSYSLYLWHWPVLMVSRPEIDVMTVGPRLWIAQAVVTGVLSELSYRYVETPVRRGALTSLMRDARRRQRPLDRMAVVFAAGAGLISLSTVGAVVINFQPAITAEQLERRALAHADEAPLDDSGALSRLPPVDGPMCQERLASAAAAVCMPTELDADEGDSDLPEPHKGKRPRLVLAIGDSVMQGAEYELRRHELPVVVDAVVGRQVSQSIPLLRTFLDEGRLAPLVVVHLGNNGTFRTRQFDRMMRLLGPFRQVVFVNNKVPRRWQDPNNQVLVEGVARYPNASLVDWNAHSAGRSDWFARDGYHLRREGARAYTDLLAAHCYIPEEHQRAALHHPPSTRMTRRAAGPLAQIVSGPPQWIGL